LGVTHHIQAFSVPKVGHQERENEDAVAFDAREGWLAVADGATEASYSREWAEILAESLTPATSRTARMLDSLFPQRRLGPVVADLQQKWHEMVPWERLEALGWLFVEKAQQGALATFLALRIVENQEWVAMGIGDCNLFVVDDQGKVRLSVPAQSAAEFGTSPSLVPSVPGPQVKQALDSLWRKTGKWKPRERMVVCTDAVAAYLLHTEQRGRSAIKSLIRVRSTEEFAEWVNEARMAGMRNDDSTVAIVTLK
jgi:serine/threonine protein phosphatase PrpC